MKMLRTTRRARPSGLYGIGDGASITLVKKGEVILGLYFMSPRGGHEWHRADGTWGEARSEDECRARIRKVD